nr:kinesin-like protein KIN-13B isoform X1 [Tanacetum cinerariifolium]
MTIINELNMENQWICMMRSYHKDYIFNGQDKNRRIKGQRNLKKAPRSESRNWSPDDELNALLKEKEDLVNAHQKQVEDTMDIVRVEMNLLLEADEP